MEGRKDVWKRGTGTVILEGNQENDGAKSKRVKNFKIMSYEGSAKSGALLYTVVH